MSLGQITRAVLDRVQHTTGYPVVVDQDPSSGLLASVRMARGSQRFHAVTYNPAGGTGHDYLICYQCGFILRLYGSPPDQRADLAGNHKGRTDVEKLTAKGLGPQLRARLGEVGVLTLRDQFYDGLLRQLRSIPVGLRVDAWLLRDYPDLAEQQSAAVTKQLNDNAGTLSPQIWRMVPAKVYQASVGMNAAFAEFWAGRRGDPLLALPYKAAGFQGAGQTLLGRLESIPDDPARDRELVDAWAADLQVQGWYAWVPYRVDD